MADLIEATAFADAAWDPSGRAESDAGDAGGRVDVAYNRMDAVIKSRYLGSAIAFRGAMYANGLEGDSCELLRFATLLDSPRSRNGKPTTAVAAIA